MPDIFENRASGLESPGYAAAEVEPDDGQDLTVTSRALWIGIPGDLRVTMGSGQIVSFANVPAGMLPLRVVRVHETGTTAGNIVAVW